MVHSQVRSCSAEIPVFFTSFGIAVAARLDVILYMQASNCILAARAAASHWWAAGGNLEQRPHRLQRWFATAAFLTLVPQSYSGRVLAASVRVVLRQPW